MLPVYVSVATQTDVFVEGGGYYELSESSSLSFISPAMSLLDLSDDEYGGCFAGRRRVTSSQTDLTLSDFDGVTGRHDSDDFDDEDLNDRFSPYEVLTLPYPDRDSGCSKTGVQSDVVREKSLQDSLLLEATCGQLLDFLRVRCDRQKSRKSEFHVDEEEDGTFSDRIFAFLPDQSVQKSTNRVVPKMGTKVVDFSRVAAMATTTPLTPVRREGIPGRNSDEKHLCQRVQRGCVDGGEDSLSKKSNPGFDGGWRSPGGGVYHSDSERSGAGNRLSLHRLRDWSSDGDARPSPGSSDFPSPVNAAAAEGRCSGDDDRAKTDFLRAMYEQYAHVMYTNKANLHHTIMVQQRLFEQQIIATGQSSSRSEGRDSAGTAAASKPHPSTIWSPRDPGDRSAVQAEWVIRRRGDGSRYITRRRPARGGGDRGGGTATEGRGKIVPVVEDGKRCTRTAMEDCGGVGERVETREIRRRQQRLEKAADPGRRTGDAPGSDLSRDPDAPVQPRKLRAKRSQKNQGMTFEELLIRHFKVTDNGTKTKTENPLLSVVTI